MSAAANLSEDQVAELSETFHLLGDPTRLRIALAVLDSPVAVGDLASRVGASPSLVSHHLRLLRAARLVRATREGRHVYYRAADEHVIWMLRGMADHVSEIDEDGGH